MVRSKLVLLSILALLVLSASAASAVASPSPMRNDASSALMGRQLADPSADPTQAVTPASDALPDPSKVTMPADGHFGILPTSPQFEANRAQFAPVKDVACPGTDPCGGN